MPIKRSMMRPPSFCLMPGLATGKNASLNLSGYQYALTYNVHAADDFILGIAANDVSVKQNSTLGELPKDCLIWATLKSDDSIARSFALTNPLVSAFSFDTSTTGAHTGFATIFGLTMSFSYTVTA
jgi:hypothetical protein